MGPESRMAGAGGWGGGGNGDLLFNGDRVSICEDGNVLGVDGGGRMTVGTH